LTTLSELRIVTHSSIANTWCDVKQVYSFKAFGIHSCACYLGDVVCASVVV